MFCPRKSLMGNSWCGKGKCCDKEGVCVPNPKGSDADPSTCKQYGQSNPVGSMCLHRYMCNEGMKCKNGICVYPTS